MCWLAIDEPSSSAILPKSSHHYGSTRDGPAEAQRLGRLYEAAADWESSVITNGRLVTGRN